MKATVQIDKELSVALIAAAEECCRARKMLENINSERSEYPIRLVELSNQLKVAKAKRTSLSVVRSAHEIAHEPYDEAEWCAAGEACERIEKEIDAIKGQMEGAIGATDILRDKLSDKHAVLSVQFESEVESLRALAEKMHAQAVQMLKDAFEVFDQLDGRYTNVNIPRISGYGNAIADVSVSDKIATQLEQLRPVIWERKISLSRLLR
ncbi:MAG: hypothetical protein K2W78_12775 [Xanthobacteraceae bacterium]|nr:hypothetical protein [Xanthobacteraceae bacterium]